MAYDAVVDSNKLNNGLSLISEEIRARSIDKGMYSFPYGILYGVRKIPKLDNEFAQSFTMFQSNTEEIGDSWFNNCKQLEWVVVNEAHTIGSYAFNGCSAMTAINTHNVETIGNGAFAYNTSLTQFIAPRLIELNSKVFYQCTSLESVDFTDITMIGGTTFGLCRSLIALVLRSESHTCVLGSTDILDGCYHFTGEVNSKYNPKGLKNGYILVPSSRLPYYKDATNWNVFSSQFRALEDYTDDGTVTGEINLNKIRSGG